jgi:uncharacterized membrane protein YvlD (DUF360 family)
MKTIRFLRQFNWRFLLVRILVNAIAVAITAAVTPKIYFVDKSPLSWLLIAVMLWLLSLLFPARFAVDNLLWALVGGLVLGLLSSFLESLLGLTMPIVPEEAAALRQQLEEEARHVHWLAAARREVAPEEQALAMEPPAPDATAAGPAVAEFSGAEPVALGPDEGSSPSEEIEAEPFDSGVSVDPEPAPEIGEEKEEDGS